TWIAGRLEIPIMGTAPACRGTVAGRPPCPYSPSWALDDAVTTTPTDDCRAGAGQRLCVASRRRRARALPGQRRERASSGGQLPDVPYRRPDGIGRQPVPGAERAAE